MSDKKVDLKLLRRLAVLLRTEDFEEGWSIEIEDAADLIKCHQDRGEEQQKHINTLTNEKLTLQAKVEELEDMLQSAIERECCNERHIEQLKTRLKASLQECDYCGAALKQEGE